MSQNESEKSSGIKFEMESSVLTMIGQLKKIALASKRNLTVVVLLVLYTFSNWSLSITNRKGYSIDLYDIIIIFLLILILKTWIRGEDILGLLEKLLSKLLGQSSKKTERKEEEEEEEVIIFNNENHQQAPRAEMEVQAHAGEIDFGDEASQEAQRARESRLIDRLASRLADVNAKLEQYKVAVAAKVQENTTRGEAKLQEVAAALGGSANMTQIQQELQKVIAEEVEKSQSLLLLNDVLRNVQEEVQEEAISNEIGGGSVSAKKSVLEALPQELKAVLECPDKENLQLSFVDYVTLVTKYESLIGTLSHDQDLLDTLEKGFQGFLSKSFSPQQNFQQKETVKANLENARVIIQQRIQNERQVASLVATEQKFNDQKAKADTLSKQNEGLQKKIQEAGAGNEAASEQIATMSRQVAYLGNALSTLQGEISHKDSKIQELIALQASGTQEIEEKKQKFTELQSQIEFLTVDKDRRIGSLSDQVGDLLKQLDEAKKHQDQQAEAAEKEAVQRASLKASLNLNPTTAVSPTEETAVRKDTSYAVSMKVLEKSVRGITELFYDKFRNIAYFDQDQLLAAFKNIYGSEDLKDIQLNSGQKSFIVDYFKNKFIVAEKEFLDTNFSSTDPSKKTFMLNTLEKNFDLLKTRLNSVIEIADIQQLPMTSSTDEREASALVDQLVLGAITDNDETFNRNLITLKKIMSKYKQSSSIFGSSKKIAPSEQRIKCKAVAILSYISENMGKIKEEMKTYLSRDMRSNFNNKVKEWKKTVEDKKSVLKSFNLQSRNMWFTLIWHDGNDLDLIVKCPCGQKIYYGMKKCEKCGTFLEIDMNAGANKNDKHPVEHIYLQKAPQIGSQWEVYCNMFRCNNNKESPFTIQIEHEDGRIVSYQGTLEFQTNPKSPVYTYTVGEGVKSQDEKLIKLIREVIDQQENFTF